MAIFGYQVKGTSDTRLVNYAWTNWYEVLESWTPDSIMVYVRCTVAGQKLRAGIYEYISEVKPGALLAQTIEYDVPAGTDGWVELPIQEPKPVFSAGRVHLMANGWGDTAPEDFRVYSTWDAVQKGAYMWWGNESVPEFVAGFFYPSDLRVSMCCSYTPTAGPPPPSVAVGLYFTATELDALKGLVTQPSHSAIWNNIKSWANAHINDSPPAEPVGESWGTWINTAAGIMLYLETMGFMYHMTENSAYADAAKNWMLSIAGWSKWEHGANNWQVITKMAVAFAAGYDFLHDYLTGAEIETIRNAMVTHIGELYDYWVAYPSWPQDYPNQNAWLAGGIGLAALALKNDYVGAPAWLNFATMHTERTLSQIGIDGGWFEGPTYVYSLDALIPFLDALRRVKGQNLFNGSNLAGVAYYFIYMNYNGRPLQFEDSYWEETYRPSDLPFMYKLASEYDDGYAQWFADNYASQSMMQCFIWKNPTLTSTSPTSLPLTKHFRGLGYVIFRTGWGNNDLLFAFKSGSSQGHAHASQNEFQIYNKGKPITCGGGYTLYSPEHGTWSHNCLLVDGGGQNSEPGDGGSLPLGTRGEILALDVHDPYYRYTLGDASAVYDDLNKWLRHVVFVEEPNYFVIYDQVAAPTHRQFDWLLHCKNIRHEAYSLSVADDLITLQKSGGNIVGSAVKLQTMVVEPEGFAYEIVHYDKPWGADYDYIKVRPPVAADTAEFLMAMFPNNARAVQEVKTGNLTGVVVSYDYRKDLILFSSNGNPVDQYVELDGNYEAIDGQSYVFEDTGVRAQFDTYQVMRLQMIGAPPPPTGAGGMAVVVGGALLGAIIIASRRKT